MCLLLITGFMVCIKCFYGVVGDEKFRKSECDTYEICDNKSVTLMTLATMRMRHYRSEEFWRATISSPYWKSLQLPLSLPPPLSSSNTSPHSLILLCLSLSSPHIFMLMI